MLHGDADTDVPYEQSVMMADELKQVGVEHELITISSGGHLFDEVGIEDPMVASAFEKVLEFLEQHTQQWQPTNVPRQGILPTKWGERKSKSSRPSITNDGF